MLSVSNKPFMPIVSNKQFKLRVIMLNVIVPSVVAPHFSLIFYTLPISEIDFASS
jgi:hypothetical protein